MRILLFCLLTMVSLASADEPPPFERVMVLTGGKMRTAAFLGTVAGAMEAGWKPDLVLSTCGGSRAASIINTSENPEDWRQIIESREYYEYRKSIRANPQFAKAGPILPVVGKMALQQFTEDLTSTPSPRYPDVFSKHLVEMPEATGVLPLSQPLSADGIRVAMIATKLEYGRDQVGKPAGTDKPLVETFITDPSTARHFESLSSPVGTAFPESLVSTSTAIETSMTRDEGARASMSEPSLVPLYSKNGTHYLAGSVDTFPVELAQKLGREVVATAGGPEEDLARFVFKDTYHYELLPKLLQSQKAPIDRWVDYTEVGVVDEFSAMGPKLKVSKKGLELVDEFPSYERYVEMMRLEWEWGRQRGLEAFRQPKGNRRHLRDDVLRYPLHLRSLKTGSTLGAKVAHVLSAPLVAILALCGELPDGDQRQRCLADAGQILGAQAPFLVSYGAVTSLLEWLRHKYLDTEVTQPPSKAWKAIKLATGVSNYETLARFTKLAVMGAGKACKLGYDKLTGLGLPLPTSP